MKSYFTTKKNLMNSHFILLFYSLLQKKMKMGFAQEAAADDEQVLCECVE